MNVAVIGAGRVGTALAELLTGAGYPETYSIVAISGRQATIARAGRYLGMSPVSSAEAASMAELVLICTPDDVIASLCAEMAAAGCFREGQWVAHVSGATGLEALAAASDSGAGILSLHPLQTFPSVEAALARIPGSGMAVTALSEEGFVLGERVARSIDARPFRLADEAKPLYHAAAVFASNYLVATTALADELFQEAGLDQPVELFMPLQRATLENIANMGPALALTGPAVRGDSGTVAKNLEALAKHAPAAVLPYVAMADVALDLAERSGRLSPQERAAVKEVLARWR
ncbi:MAG: Rossmann-like and DUF2520 domain-containing protein [Actinomycetota bacterium]